MKTKALHLLFSLFVLMVPVMMTSCQPDDDFEVAATLDGYWEGELSTGYYYNNYGAYNWATIFEFDSYAPGVSTSGTGVEIDYSPSYYSQNRYYYFKWEVAYGNIYLHFDNGEELVIRDYMISGNRLRGDLETPQGELVGSLNLVRTDYLPWTRTRSSDVVKPQMGGKRSF